MRRRISSTTASGVITVYLALILLLILSLVFTVIEGARISTAKVYAERALSTAMDSVWAEYYEPLWKEYHLFGYAAGEGSAKDKAEKLKEKLMKYMSYTFQPGTGLEPEISRDIELYDIQVSSLSVTDQTGIMDYNGELMRKEAVGYMKYHELADGLTLLLKKLSLLEKPKKVSVVYDKKLEAEGELAKADQNILRLMELLDGIKTSKTGVKLDKERRLQIAEHFAKKLCVGPVSMETTGINHNKVFEATKDRYIDPVILLGDSNLALEQLDVIVKQLLMMNEEIEAAQAAHHSAMSKQKSIPDTDTETETEGQQNKTVNNEVDYLKDQLDRLYSKQRELSEQKRQLTSQAEAKLNYINKIISVLIPIVEEAEQEAEKVISNATASAHLIEEFEESLYEEKESLGEEVFAALEEKLWEMKRYTASYEENEGFYDMQDTLRYDLMLLKEGQKAIHKAQAYLMEEDHPAALNSSKTALSELRHYEISSLTIDYNTLVLDQNKQSSPIEKIGSLMEGGITSMLLDPVSISESVLMSEQLPSMEASLSMDNTDASSMITSFFEDAMKGGEEHGINQLLYNFGHTTDVPDLIMDSVDWVTERLLYQEYLTEHFEYYPTGENKPTERKPSVLSYEQEYLLAGEDSDRENLSEATTRIVLLRMILNFVTLLGDKTCCEEARLAATALVGFTGLPMLISIMQAVLLMVWSFAEALVDTCALLIGKELPLLKQKLSLKFPELFLLNRVFIRSKAEALASSGQLIFSYQDYLRMFLLIKNQKDLTFRSMDLIQENLMLRYEDKLFLRDCLFGYEASAVYTIDAKFITVPILRSSVEHNVSSYPFSCKAVYSY
jgi:hypothetical protein